MNARPMIRSLAALGSCCLATAQTYVVDAGGGGNFTDLPQAIAAVPSGAVLRVKPGSYSAFTVANKSLTIVGDSAATVTVSMAQDVQIGPTAAAERVVLRDLRFVPAVPPFLPIVRAVRCADASGPVLFENLVVDVTGLFLTELVVTRSVDVHLLGCDLASLAYTPLGQPVRVSIYGSSVEISRTRIRGYSGALNEGFPATDAVRASGGSRLMVVDSTLTGGDGGSAFPPRNQWSYPGGVGLALSTGSAAHVYGRTAIQGGAGGSSYLGLSQYPPSSGGDGIALADSSARILGVVPVGGAGGGGNPPAPPGKPVSAAGTSTYEWDPAPAVVAADVLGTQAPGQTIGLAVQTYPATWAAMVLDTSLDFGVALPVQLGARCVRLTLVLGPFSVPSSGTVQVPLTLPLTVPLDSYVFGQWFVLDPTRTELQSSNVFTLLMKS